MMLLRRHVLGLSSCRRFFLRPRGIVMPSAPLASNALVVDSRASHETTQRHSLLPLPQQHTTIRRRGSSSGGASPPSSSVSKDEVSKFSEMDDLWWDPDKHPLVAMNPVRVGYIVDTLRRLGCCVVFQNKEETQQQQHHHHPPLENLRALDVGCGGGLLSESLARLGATVTAIDPSEALVERAREHAHLDERTQSIDYRGGVSVEQLASSWNEEKFDVICILEVIEHVTNVESLLQAAASLLKPEGVLFVSTVNRTWKSHILAIVGAEYIMGYIPVGTHDWDLFRSPSEVRGLMEKAAALRQVDVTGMILTMPPLDGKWRWRLEPRDTDVNWIGAYRHSQASTKS